MRRVVTGLNAEGKSCIVIDGPLAPLSPTTALAWRTEGLPADNTGSADAVGQGFSPAMLAQGGATFLVAEHLPGAAPHWHAIDALAYVVVLEGEMVLALETGEVRLRRGDMIANRGVMHGWYNGGSERAAMAVVTVPAGSAAA